MPAMRKSLKLKQKVANMPFASEIATSGSTGIWCKCKNVCIDNVRQCYTDMRALSQDFTSTCKLARTGWLDWWLEDGRCKQVWSHESRIAMNHQNSLFTMLHTCSTVATGMNIQHARAPWPIYGFYGWSPPHWHPLTGFNIPIMFGFLWSAWPIPSMFWPWHLWPKAKMFSPVNLDTPPGSWRVATWAGDAQLTPPGFVESTGSIWIYLSGSRDVVSCDVAVFFWPGCDMVKRVVAWCFRPLLPFCRKCAAWQLTWLRLVCCEICASLVPSYSRRLQVAAIMICHDSRW